MPRNLTYEVEAKYVRFGCITSSDGDTLAYAKQASEASIITISDSCRVYAKHLQGRLPFGVSSSAILIAFDAVEYVKLQARPLHSCTFDAKVEFEIRKLYFRTLHYSLKSLSDEVIQKLVPTDDMFSSCRHKEFYPVSQPPYEAIELDGYAQLKALYLILMSPPDLPVLVAGSFGTGKTRLLARAAYEILRQRTSRVLICAHHQISVDTFVKYFCEMKNTNNDIWAVNMIRVIANDSYRSVLRDKYEEYGIFKSKYDILLQDLQDCELVLTTFSTASNLFRRLRINPGHELFTDILIDEGAQVREPEMVGALAWAGRNTKIVIAGDHYQVCSKL